MMNKKFLGGAYALLLLALIAAFPLVATAEVSTLLVEFQRPPSAHLLNVIKQKLTKQFPQGQITFKIFDSYPSDYFQRLYRLDLNFHKDMLPQKLLPIISEFLLTLPVVKNIEKVYPITSEWLTTIIPNVNASSEKVFNDPLFSFQWGLFNDGQSLIRDIDDLHSRKILGVPQCDIGLAQALPLINKKLQRDVVVAVIDSGVDLDHPDLLGKVAINKTECVSSGNKWIIPARPREDKDHNGLVGDCMGYNFLGTTPQESARPYDDIGHGTHIAGIMAALSHNAQGIAGISSRIKILPIKIMSTNEKRPGQKILSFTDRLAQGILYAAKMHVDVINLSLGWPASMDTQYLRQAIATAIAQGISVVAAAGNNSSDHALSPCAYPQVICVGSVGVQGEISPFSNYGGKIDFAAPGESILSLSPLAITPLYFSQEGYEYKSGTSQAAPYISAMVAILKGIYPAESLDSLYARLAISSQQKAQQYGQITQKDHSWFAQGMPQLDVAIALPAPAQGRPFIAPIFKDQHILTLQSPQDVVNIPIHLKNYGAPLKTPLLVHVEIENNVIELQKSLFTVPTLGTSQVYTIMLQGYARDFSADHHMTITVHWQGDEAHKIAKASYSDRWRLLRTIENDPQLLRLPLATTFTLDQILLPPSPQGDLQKWTSFLRTLEDPFSQWPHPEYYLPLPVQKEQLSIALFRWQRGSATDKDHYQQLSKNICIPFAQKLLTLQKLDVDFDHRGDYLVRTLVSRQGQSYIQYSYFDGKLRPLGHNYFLPKDAILNPANMNFIRLTTTESAPRPLLTPVTLEDGKVPTIDRNPDPWSPDTTDDLELTHLYFLPPDLTATAPSEMRILDNFHVRKQWRKTLGLSRIKKMQIMHLLPQTLQQQQKGEILFILAVGDASQGIYYVGRYGHNQDLYSFTPIENPQLLNIDQDPIFPLTESAELTSLRGSNTSQQLLFARAYDRQTLRLGLLTGLPTQPQLQEIILKSPLPDEVIANFRRGNVEEDHYSFIYQTQNHMVLHTLNMHSREEHTYWQPLQHFSFLPQHLLDEWYYPVWLHHQNSRQMGFYVDATALSPQHLYTFATAPGKSSLLLSPIASSISLPEQCIPLNPSPYVLPKEGGSNESKQSPHAFTFLCWKMEEQKTQWELRFLPLNN